MLNTKLKHVLLFLVVIIVPQAMPAAEKGCLLGLELEHPSIRLTIGDYVSTRGAELCKLAIWCRAYHRPHGASRIQTFGMYYMVATK
jgi:hypothetical protein